MGWQVSAGELCCPTCTVNGGAWVFPARLELAGENDQSTRIRAEPCPFARLVEGPGWHRERTAFLASWVDFVIPCLRREEWLLLECHNAFGAHQPFSDPFLTADRGWEERELLVVWSDEG